MQEALAQEEEPLPLPDARSKAPKLRIGEKLALDKLGPLIVTADGGLGSIANWQARSEGEREVAVHRLARRNQEVLATLEEQRQQQQDQQRQEL